MTKRTMDSTLQLRVPTVMFARLDRLAVVMEGTSVALASGRMTRSMVARLALDEGLAGLELTEGALDGAGPTEGSPDLVACLPRPDEGCTMNDSQRLLTLDEVAERLAVARQTVSRWARSGHLPGVWLGSRTVRVRAADLEAWIEAGRPADDGEGGAR